MGYFLNECYQFFDKPIAASVGLPSNLPTGENPGSGNSSIDRGNLTGDWLARDSATMTSSFSPVTSSSRDGALLGDGVVLLW